MNERLAPIAALARLVGLAALLAASSGGAQMPAPGEPVVIPGIEISGWSRVAEVPGRFGGPAGTTAKAPAVLILHGSNGVDGRGAFYAQSLQAAGIATLEITMFPPGGRPSAGQKATMPHAAAALKWLAAQPSVDGQRLGILGFSWGGSMAVWMSSEDTQEHFGKDVPRPAAVASFYPVCSNLVRYSAKAGSGPYIAQTRMSAAPMLIFVGTADDYEIGARPCDALVAMWPAAAREHATVHYVQGATHAFDSQTGPRQFYDQFAHAEQGATINVIPNPEAAAEARRAVVAFFVTNLRP